MLKHQIKIAHTTCIVVLVADQINKEICSIDFLGKSSIIQLQFQFLVYCIISFKISYSSKNGKSFMLLWLKSFWWSNVASIKWLLFRDFWNLFALGDLWWYLKSFTSPNPSRVFIVSRKNCIFGNFAVCKFILYDCISLCCHETVKINSNSVKVQVQFSA